MKGDEPLEIQWLNENGDNILEGMEISRMKNVGFCFLAKKIYDKISKSWESRVLEDWFYGKCIQDYRWKDMGKKYALYDF